MFGLGIIRRSRSLCQAYIGTTRHPHGWLMGQVSGFVLHDGPAAKSWCQAAYCDAQEAAFCGGHLQSATPPLVQQPPPGQV